MRFSTWFFRTCIILIVPLTGCAQTSPQVHADANIQVQDRAFDQKLTHMLEFDVPLIAVDSLYQDRTSFILLDIRTAEEYQTSHIPDAQLIHVGSNDLRVVEHLSRNQPIVVYCSVGYRSEKFGKILIDGGFTSVFNLYGSIFEWVNAGYPVVDSRNRMTNKVHTYSRRWAKYITNPDIQKTW